MKKYSLPTRKECFDTIKEYHVPLHILKHSLAVAKLAVFLAERLEEKGVAVDVNLVDRACLLHDIVRVCGVKEPDYRGFEQTITEQDKAKWGQIRTRYKGRHHEDIAYELLKEEYPVLALTIRKHRYMAITDEREKPSTWEEKLVYYADKRIMREKIVPLKERLEEAHKRNVGIHGTAAQSKLNTAKVDPLIYKLEEEIFNKVGLNPVEVTDRFIDSYPDKRQKKD